MLTGRERWRVVMLAVLAIVAALLEALSIGAVFPFILLLGNPDAILSHPVVRDTTRFFGWDSVNAVVVAGACGLLVLYLLKNLFLVWLYAFQSRFVAEMESRLGVQLLSGYLRAPYSLRLSRNSADRIRIITTEVGRVTVGVMLALIALFSEGMLVATIILLLLVAQPLVAGIALVVLGLVAGVMQTVFRRKLDTYRESRVRTLSGMFRWINEGLGALKEIKVLGRQDHVLTEFRRNSEVYAHGTYLFTTLNLMPRVVFEGAAVSVLMLAIMVTVATGGSLSGIVPLLTVFGLAAVRLLPSLSRIMASFNTLRYYGSAVDAVALDLRLVASAAGVSEDSHRSAPKKDRFLSLQLSSVSYRFPGDNEDTLKDISLRIERGESLAIVGRSGAGKTTLADLMLGLLEPTTGTIEVNGVPVHSLKDEWRGIAGLVPQEFFLMDDTVRRNVAFGLPDSEVDDARVWRSLSMAGLDHRVSELAAGLDASVGERGAMLSGGERQRLGIARALYTDPEILVLDEATSSLDTATEADFLAVLQSLRGTKTIIIITHRPAPIGWCGRLLIVRDGRVVGDGSLDEIKQRSHFAELAEIGH
jgi:ABC-type multidrug transport system fused ATPase/permease subunit